MVGGREGPPVVVRAPKSGSFCLLLLKVQHSITWGSFQTPGEAPANRGTWLVPGQAWLVLQLPETPQREICTNVWEKMTKLGHDAERYCANAILQFSPLR